MQKAKRNSALEGLLANCIIKNKDNADLISGNYSDEFLDTTCVLTPLQQSEIQKNFPRIEMPSRNLVEFGADIQSAYRFIIFQGKFREHKFPLRTILPKVQLNRIVPRKQLPRDVQVDRKRREYAKYKLEDELKRAGITMEDLHPTEDEYNLLSAAAFKRHFLPISFFDDINMDVHSCESWLNLGRTETETYYVPVKAFLPVEKSLVNCRWEYAAAMSFDEDTNLWTVMSIWEEKIFHVPRLQIMFLAEDPKEFVKRVKCAVDKRNKAEAIMHLNAMVDSLLLQSLSTEKFTLQPSVAALVNRMSCSEHFRSSITLELFLVFEHLMTYFGLEKFVKSYPKEFPMLANIERKDVYPTKIMKNRHRNEDRAFLKSLHLDTKDVLYKLLQSTLYYNRAGVEAMAHGHDEGTYIEKLSLFACSIAKALQLPEFLQVQNQNSAHVTNYLKNFWPSKIASGIIIVLRQLGRGWLDITISDWSIYNLCKISRFVFQVKLRMQESMQIFLENSIRNFIKFLTEPCVQFLELNSNFVWTNDYKTTHFPYKKPIFLLTIGVNEEEKVYYSTTPEDIEPALCEVFKSTLERTSGVRCIDSELMSFLRFAPNLFIMTVELIEDMYIEKNAYMQQCYRQGLIPLHAYAKLYERFIPFCLLNVPEYMKDYRESKKSSADVKNDIVEHQRQHRELKEILPESIAIGPYLINVETIKTYMIKKHKDLVRLIFDYYIDRMYEINSDILERCETMYNRINERPYSIEHLFSIRDYAANLPEMVQELRDDINIMCMEYEILDGFFYNLSDTQFAMKWDAFAWPLKILQRNATLLDEQKIDIEEFKRQHASECISFEEHLQSVNDEVQAFSLLFDAAKVVEISVDVKKTWNIILSLQETYKILAFRQKILELEDLSAAFLHNIIEAFTPYKILWGAGADMLKLEDATFGNPMATLEFDEITKSVNDLRSSLQSVYVIFRDKPEIQDVAKTFLRNIERFQPLFTCIKYITTENWLSPHWEELRQRSGLEFKYAVNLTFQQLLRKGIMQHFDLVREISMRADLEADEVRRAMEEEERRRKEEEEKILLRKQMRKCRRDIL